MYSSTFSCGLGGVTVGIDRGVHVPAKDFTVPGIRKPVRVGIVHQASSQAIAVNLALFFQYRPKKRHEFFASLRCAGVPVLLHDFGAVALVERLVVGQRSVHSAKQLLPAQAVQGDDDQVFGYGLLRTGR